MFLLVTALRRWTDWDRAALNYLHPETAPAPKTSEPRALQDPRDGAFSGLRFKFGLPSSPLRLAAKLLLVAISLEISSVFNTVPSFSLDSEVSKRPALRCSRALQGSWQGGRQTERERESHGSCAFGWEFTL